MTNLERLRKMEKEKVRKGGQIQGVRTQKMMSFRVDNDLLEWLYQVPNKGRLINQLLYNEMMRQKEGAD